MATKLVIGCNYHTTWQKQKGMRFVLAEIRGDEARLVTRKTGRNFWTPVSSLIFIETEHNKNKSIKLQIMTDDDIEKKAEEAFPFAEMLGGETYTAYKGFIEGAKWVRDHYKSNK